ncbi:hypothetical protein DL770_007397 [Monosporascus sp. CRB-9-2]|nr:hypothetical protein DL770_007397 [Monosporascus sp. CRB-9-2]
MESPDGHIFKAESPEGPVFKREGSAEHIVKRERSPDRDRARSDIPPARRQDNRSSHYGRSAVGHERWEPRGEPRGYRGSTQYGPYMGYDRRGHLGSSNRSERGGYRDDGRYEPGYRDYDDRYERRGYRDGSQYERGGYRDDGRYEPSHRGSDDGYERRGYRHGSQYERGGYSHGSQYERRSHRDDDEDLWDAGRLVRRREVTKWKVSGRSRSPLRWQSPPRYRSRSRRGEDHPPPRGRSRRPEYYDSYEEDDRYGYHRSNRGHGRVSPSPPRRALLPPPPPPPPQSRQLPVPQASGKRVWLTPMTPGPGAKPPPDNRNSIRCGNCDRFHDPRLCRGPVNQGRIDICPRCGSRRHLFEDCPWGDPAVDDTDFFLWHPRQGLAPIATRIDLSDREAVPGHHLRPVHSRQFAQQLYSAEKQEMKRLGLPFLWKTIDYGSLQSPEFEALKNPVDPSLVGYKFGPPANKNPRQGGDPAAPLPGPERGVRQDTSNDAAAMPFPPRRGVRRDTRNDAAAMPFPERSVSQDTRNPPAQPPSTSTGQDDVDMAGAAAAPHGRITLDQFNQI